MSPWLAVQRSLASLLCAAAVIVIAGCGDEGASTGFATATDSDAKQISSVIRQVGTVDDGQRLCGGVFTAALVRRIYTNRSSCLASVSPDQDAGDDELRPSRIQTDGDRGRVAITVAKTAVEGHVLLLHDADRWKVDDFGSDLLRSLAVQAAGDGVPSGIGGQGPKVADELRRRGVGACARSRLAKLPDAQVRAIGYAALGQDNDKINVALNDLVFSCLAGPPSGRRAARAVFEQSIRDHAPTAAVTGCVTRRLRATLSSKVIARETVATYRRDDGEPSPILQRAITEATRVCRR